VHEGVVGRHVRSRSLDGEEGCESGGAEAHASVMTVA
jgi:hypothetical protein